MAARICDDVVLPPLLSSEASSSDQQQQLLLHLWSNHLSEAAYSSEVMGVMDTNNDGIRGSCDHYRYQSASGHHNDNDYTSAITSNSLLMELLQVISGGDGDGDGDGDGGGVHTNNDDENHNVEHAHSTIANSTGPLMDADDVNYKVGAPYPPTSFLAMKELELDYSVQALLPILSTCHGDDSCDCAQELELAGPGIDYRPATPIITPLTPTVPAESCRVNNNNNSKVIERSSRRSGGGGADHHSSSSNSHSHEVMTCSTSSWPISPSPSPSLLEYTDNYHNSSSLALAEMAELRSAQVLNNPPPPIHGDELQLGHALANPRSSSQFRRPNTSPCYNRSIRDTSSQFCTPSAHEAVNSSSSSSCGHVSPAPAPAPAPATNRSHFFTSSSHHDSTSACHRHCKPQDLPASLHHAMASSAEREVCRAVSYEAPFAAGRAESVGAAGIMENMATHQQKQAINSNNMLLYNEPILLAAAAAAASSKAELYRRAAMAPIDDDDDDDGDGDEPLAMAGDDGIHHHHHEYEYEYNKHDHHDHRSSDFSCRKALKMSDGGKRVALKVVKKRRRNVKISKDPQSVAARQRRERISERILTLQRYVPWARKLDTASMLEEAVQYLKFLKAEVQSYADMMMMRRRSSSSSSSSSSSDPPTTTTIATSINSFITCSSAAASHHVNSNGASSIISALPAGPGASSLSVIRDSAARSEGNHRHRHGYVSNPHPMLIMDPGLLYNHETCFF